MNKPLELVYESMYTRLPINESLASLQRHEIYSHIKKALHDMYGVNVIDLLSMSSLQDIKRMVYKTIEESDLDNAMKYRILDRVSIAPNLCKLYMMISLGGLAH